MYNCLKYCQRLFNTFTSEAVDQVIVNRRIYSNGRIIPRYFNSVSSAFKEGRIITKEKVSNFDEFITYIKNLNRIQTEQISQLLTNIKDDQLTENQVLFILECCNNSIPGENNKSKYDLCQSILKRFASDGKFSEKVYESYINICTENRQCLDVESLVPSLGSNLTLNLLKLILKNVCECGDSVKAMKIVSEMKKRNYAADEEVFNYLTLAHTIEGGLSSGLKVVQTMKRAKFKETDNTHFLLIKGLAQRKNFKEFIDAFEQYKISYSEDMIMSLLEALAFNENHEWVKHLMNSIDKTLLSKYFPTKLDKLCTYLVYNGKYDGAFEIYKIFVDAKDNSSFGGHILREMVLCSAPIKKIVEFANDLKESGLNDFALERVTESALRNEMFSTAMNLLCHFSTLKPHYFWPILVEAHLKDGEIGILDIVETAMNMNVKFSTECFAKFILPRCDLRSPKRVLTMFQEKGYTIKMLLTPMIIVLLQRKKVDEAVKLCESYKEVTISSEGIITALTFTWLSTGKHKECMLVLQKVLESESDFYPGKFLVEVLDKIRSLSKLKSFIELLREFKRKNLTINNATAETMLDIVNEKFYASDTIEEIQRAVNDILDFTIIPTVHPFLHREQMSIEQLELHLVELKSKGMETRGVLRKLIQKYSGQGNPQRVRELQEELFSKGYGASPGMKSALLYSHVQEGNLEEAMRMYNELMQTAHLFRMDHFKIVDLASLLVKRNKFNMALEILKRSAVQSDSIGTVRCSDRNCLNLLKSTEDMDKQMELFKVLVDCGYCEPSNVILGAVIQLHLEKDTVENTVDLYVDFCKKYGKTPMQVVLLAKLLESKSESLLQKALDASAAIHGNIATRSALVVAMCEQGMVRQVVAVLLDSKLNPSKDLEKRCDRWVVTNNLNALQTLLAASKELPPKLLNIPKIQLAIMQVYSKRNDCDGALAFWKSLVDEQDHVDAAVDNEFCELLSRCKFSSPENLTMKYKLK